MTYNRHTMTSCSYSMMHGHILKPWHWRQHTGTTLGKGHIHSPLVHPPTGHATQAEETCVSKSLQSAYSQNQPYVRAAGTAVLQALQVDRVGASFLHLAPATGACICNGMALHAAQQTLTWRVYPTACFTWVKVCVSFLHLCGLYFEGVAILDALCVLLQVPDQHALPPGSSCTASNGCCRSSNYHNSVQTSCTVQPLPQSMPARRLTGAGTNVLRVPIK